MHNNRRRKNDTKKSIKLVTIALAGIIILGK